MSTRSHLDPAAARARGLLARREMSPRSRDAASAGIAAALGRLPELASARTVAGYWPATHEVDLVDLWQRLDWLGVSVHLPRIDPGGGPVMDFVRWKPDAQMLANRFGVPEPAGEATALADIDVVVVPCTAVDDAGTRVGMGAGFYDRALGESGHRRPDGPGGPDGPDGSGHPRSGVSRGSDASHDNSVGPRPLVVAAAFEPQRITAGERILRRDWDVPVDVIVTDSVTLRPE